MSIPLTGLFPAAYTPMNEDGSLNVSAIKRLAELYAQSGVSGVFVGGTTGECYSLTLEERQALTEFWVSAAGRRLSVIVHVGSNCLDDAMHLASHARESGAQGIAAMAPFFFKPSTVDQLVSYCQPIAASGRGLPFYFYHIPVVTGVHLPMAEFLRQASQHIPALAGLKYSSSELMDLQECLMLEEGRFDLFYGSDESLLAGWALGVRAAIGSTYNYAAPLYHRMIDAYEAGDMRAAQQEQGKSVELVRTLKKFGPVAAGKAMMKLMGVDCGPVRPPLELISDEDLIQIYQHVKHLDIFTRPFDSTYEVLAAD